MAKKNRYKVNTVKGGKALADTYRRKMGADELQEHLAFAARSHRFVDRKKQASKTACRGRWGQRAGTKLD